MTLIYAVLCDLKAVAWRNLQECHPNSEDSTQDILQHVQKRRKTAVSFSSSNTSSSTNGTEDSASSSTSFVLPPAEQKLLDSLQQHQNQFELSNLSDRMEHFLADKARNEQSFELFEWDLLLDVNTYAGGALVNL